MHPSPASISQHSTTHHKKHVDKCALPSGHVPPHPAALSPASNGIPQPPATSLPQPFLPTPISGWMFKMKSAGTVSIGSSWNKRFFAIEPSSNVISTGGWQLNYYDKQVDISAKPNTQSENASRINSAASSLAGTPRVLSGHGITPSGSIGLATVHQLQPLEQSLGHTHCIMISTPARFYVLRATNELECKTWLSTLTQYVDAAKTKLQQYNQHCMQRLINIRTAQSKAASKQVSSDGMDNSAQSKSQTETQPSTSSTDESSSGTPSKDEKQYRASNSWSDMQQHEPFNSAPNSAEKQSVTLPSEPQPPPRALSIRKDSSSMAELNLAVADIYMREGADDTSESVSSLPPQRPPPSLPKRRSQTADPWVREIEFGDDEPPQQISYQLRTSTSDQTLSGRLLSAESTAAGSNGFTHPAGRSARSNSTTSALSAELSSDEEDAGLENMKTTRRSSSVAVSVKASNQHRPHSASVFAMSSIPANKLIPRPPTETLPLQARPPSASLHAPRPPPASKPGSISVNAVRHGRKARASSVITSSTPTIST